MVRASGECGAGPDRWAALGARLAQAVRDLATHRGCLLLGLLAVNALFLPYRSRYHYAIIY